MRVAFDDGPVHECARIAFVGVADEVFLAPLVLPGQPPFAAGGEAAAAAAAQPAELHLGDHLDRRLAVQGLDESGVAAPGDVFLDPGGIDAAAVGQHPPGLGREKGMLVDERHAGVRPVFRVAELAQPPVLGDLVVADGIEDGGHAVGGDMGERDPGAAGHLDVEQRLGRAHADAAHLDEIGGELVFPAVVPDRLRRLFGSGAQPAGAGAHIDHRLRDEVAAQPGQRVAEPIRQPGRDCAAGGRSLDGGVRNRGGVSCLHGRLPSA